MYRSCRRPWSSSVRRTTKLRAKMREKRKKRRRDEKDVEEEERKDKKSKRKNEGITSFPFSDRNAKWRRQTGLFSSLGTRASSMRSFLDTFLFFRFYALLSPFDLMGFLWEPNRPHNAFSSFYYYYYYILFF